MFFAIYSIEFSVNSIPLGYHYIGPTNDTCMWMNLAHLPFTGDLTHDQTVSFQLPRTDVRMSY